MAAFKKPDKEGLYSPGPWKTVSGGLSFRINSEIYIPKSFKIEGWFDRLNAAWWIISLMRMRISSIVQVPVVSDISFSNIVNSEIEPNFHTIEIDNKNRLIIEDEPKINLQVKDFEWIEKYWLSAGKLMQNEVFNDTYTALDRSLTDNRLSLSMITIWGALERIFSPAKQELRYRVSLNIASFLSDKGEERLKLFKKVLKLYDARSKAAHGSATEDFEEFRESYNLLKSALVKMIEENKIPSQMDLEKLVMK